MSYIKIVGTIFVAVSGILMCSSFLRKNEYYFNLRSVIKRHLRLFKNCKSQYVIFYGLPLLFSAGLALLCEANSQFFSELSVILSILISILFAILSILCGQDYATVSNEEQKKRAKVVLLDTVNAIVFTAFLCIFLLLYGLVFSLVDAVAFDWLPFNIEILKRIVSGVAYYFFTVILFNLFLIFKHMSKLIEFNLNAPKKEN